MYQNTKSYFKVKSFAKPFRGLTLMLFFMIRDNSKQNYVVPYDIRKSCNQFVYDRSTVFLHAMLSILWLELVKKRLFSFNVFEKI